MDFATVSSVGRGLRVSHRKRCSGPGAGRASAGGGGAAESTARRAGAAVSGAGQGIPGRSANLLESSRQAHGRALGEAKTYEERQKVEDEVYPKPEKLAPRFLVLAENYPRDPVAFDALTWIVVNCVRSPARIPARAKAVAILSRDHARSEKFGPMCQTFATGYDEETEILLTAIMDKNPSKAVQA